MSASPALVRFMAETRSFTEAMERILEVTRQAAEEFRRMGDMLRPYRPILTGPESAAGHMWRADDWWRSR